MVLLGFGCSRNFWKEPSSDWDWWTETKDGGRGKPGMAAATHTHSLLAVTGNATSG